MSDLPVSDLQVQVQQDSALACRQYWRDQAEVARDVGLALRTTRPSRGQNSTPDPEIGKKIGKRVTNNMILALLGLFLSCSR